MSVRSEVAFNGSQRLRSFHRRSLKSAGGQASLTVGSETISPLLFVLHVPLGVLMYSSSAIATVHPLLVFMLGMYWAVRNNVAIVRPAYVAAYLIGVEVLWRMTDAPVYWEFGKYGSAAIMLFALARRGLFRIPSFPLLYLILLIPACFATFAINYWDSATNKISFNMSGPFCLFVSCWFFSHIKLSESELKKLLLYVAMPLLSVAVATLFFTVTNPNLHFTNESNHATSGGFGPNQVSSVLGLGVFLVVAALVSFKNKAITTAMLGGLALLFAAQSVLTFSRGGIYAAVGALVALAVFQARNFDQFLRRFLPVMIVVGIFVFLVFPSLNNFTGGKLEERFETNDTTSRVSIIEQELDIFMQNPLFGVGAGQVMHERYLETQHAVASHTELTRLLSEHGSLGVLAILFLLAASVANIRHQPTRTGKAFVAGCLVWAGLCMTNTGMRIAAPAFIWGLSFALVTDSINRKRGNARRPKRYRAAAFGGSPARPVLDVDEAF